MTTGRESVRAAIAKATAIKPTLRPRETMPVDRRPQWLKNADDAGKASYDEETGRRVGRWARVESTPFRKTPLEPLKQGSYRPRSARGLRKPPKS